MNLRLMMWVPLGLAAAGLAGCWDAENTSTSAAPMGPTDFSTFTAELITGKTCDTTLPVDVNSVEFTFAADQDMATPVDVDTLTPKCGS